MTALLSADPPKHPGVADNRAAAAVIRKAIADADGPLPPVFLMEFLLRQWRGYLAYVHRRAGSRSIIWRNAGELTGRIVASTVPLPSREARDAMVRGLPKLVHELKTGMTIAGMTAAEREGFLVQLRAHHLSLLSAPLAVVPASQPDLSQTVAMNVVDPRYRALLDQLDGLDRLEHIDM